MTTPLEQYEILSALLLDLDYLATGECSETVDNAWLIQESIFRALDSGEIPTISQLAAFERAVYLAQDCIEWVEEESAPPSDDDDTVPPTTEELEELPEESGGHRWATAAGIGLLAAAGLGYLATRRK